jgi:hypothetical protein
MVAGNPEFVPVLPDDFQRQVPILAVARPEALRSARVQGVITALKEEVDGRQNLLAA